MKDNFTKKQVRALTPKRQDLYYKPLLFEVDYLFNSLVNKFKKHSDYHSFNR